MRIPRFWSMFAFALAAQGATAVFAQDYPNKPIRIVTGSVGGGSDTAADCCWAAAAYG
jgi:tripartite-type tricarboxylate transporter receptor subunit TctC